MKTDVTSAAKQVCFVIMPFGKKRTPGLHGEVDFNQVYEAGIKPAIESSKLKCVRADEEESGGIIHSAMFARLLMSEFVIADLTTANPNVFYELGIRHAARRQTTIPIYSPPTDLPFDVAPLRAIPYELTDGKLADESATKLRTSLLDRIRNSLDGPMTLDSPLFELLQGYPGIEIDPGLTDAFADRAVYADRFSSTIEAACLESDSERAATRLRVLEESLVDLGTVETGLLVKLFFAYRRCTAWPEIISLYEHVPSEVQTTVAVRRMYAMALCRNKAKSPDYLRQGLQELERLVREHSDDVDTYGALGRVYKDLWAQADRDGHEINAMGFLERAIDAYRRGFLIDPMDTYTGMNAVSLLLRLGTHESQEEAKRIVGQARGDSRDSVTTLYENSFLLISPID